MYTNNFTDLPQSTIEMAVVGNLMAVDEGQAH
jgi:hypothetical protein